MKLVNNLARSDEVPGNQVDVTFKYQTRRKGQPGCRSKVIRGIVSRPTWPGGRRGKADHVRILRRYINSQAHILRIHQRAPVLRNVQDGAEFWQVRKLRGSHSSVGPGARASVINKAIVVLIGIDGRKLLDGVGVQITTKMRGLVVSFE